MSAQSPMNNLEMNINFQDHLPGEYSFNHSDLGVDMTIVFSNESVIYENGSCTDNDPPTMETVYSCDIPTYGNGDCLSYQDVWGNGSCTEYSYGTMRKFCGCF